MSEPPSSVYRLPSTANHKVLLKKDEFTDPSRDNRPVPFKLYYPDPIVFPAQAGNFSSDQSDPRFRGEDMVEKQKTPLILWSHGFGGNRDGAAFLSRYLAGHGYAVLHLTHIGTDSSLWEGKLDHPWDILRQTTVDRQTTLNRFHDVPFVLDQLPEWFSSQPDIAPIDFESIGMSGHSFGALSTQVAAGQKIPDENENLISLREERIKAGILYSPVPVGHMIKDTGAAAENIYGPIGIPLLHMTGTEDASPIGGNPYEHRLVIYENSGHPEKYLLIKQGGDHMVYNGTRGKLDANPLREQHEEIIQATSLAFWDAMLKGDETAKAWLQESAQEWLGERGDFITGTYTFS